VRERKTTSEGVNERERKRERERARERECMSGGKMKKR